MIEVTRERVVAAPPAWVWEQVADVTRMARWFSFAESIEVLEGEGLGRRQRQHGRWGSKRSEIDQVVTAFDPPRRFEWRHQAERLDGKPAPRFARDTRFTVAMAAEEAGTR